MVVSIGEVWWVWVKRYDCGVRHQGLGGILLALMISMQKELVVASLC